MQFHDDEPLTIHAEDADDAFVPGFDDATGSEARGNFESLLLLAAGFGATAGGLAFALAPHFSSKVDAIGQKVAALGLPGGTLFMGGLMLLGLGFVARRRANDVPVVSPLPPRREPDIRGKLRDDFDALSLQVGTIGERLNELVALQNSAQPTDPAAEREDMLEAVAKKQNSALFRLAASLDQLGARLEKHFDRRVEMLADRLNAIDDRLMAGPTEEASLPQASRAPVTEVEALPVEREPSLGVLDSLDDAGSPVGAAPAHAQAQVQVQVQVQPQPTAEQAPPAPAPQPQALPQAAPAETAQAQVAPPQAAPVPAQPAPQPAPPAPAQDAASMLPQTAFRPAPNAGPSDDVAAPFPADHRPNPNAVGIEGSADDLESLLPDYRVREAIDVNRNPRNAD